MDINSPIEALPGIGKKRAELYHKLGIHTMEELIFYFPRDYIDYTTPVPIGEAPINEHSVISAVIKQKLPAARIRPGLTLYKLVGADDTDSVTITYYNNPYAADKLTVGSEYRFFGRVTGGFMRKEMNSPQYIGSDEQCMCRPVYKLTEGLTANMLTQNMLAALKCVGDDHPDPLPAAIRQKYELCTEGYALHNIHFPESDHGAELARRRLSFDELLILSLGMSVLKYRNRQTTAHTMDIFDISEFFRALPFEPTNAQKRVCGEIFADMCGKYPMNRLVQGDVGSGKTAVAAAACWLAVKNGCQAALMAPTEILAVQHAGTLSGFLSPLGIKVACLTGSLTPKRKKEIREQLADGSIDVVAGTHALISESTEFRSLGLVITDEQHRFGVNQRKAFAGKGDSPHKLVMSATPIPRTLGLIIYGDLDISVLDELPRGRSPVETYAVTGKLRSRALGFVKKQLEEGRQGYIVCPLITDSEQSEAMAAQSYKEKLENGMFSGYTVGLLHGQMSGAEKDAVMADFKDGKIDLLVCTTVVEVGVDVPNATIMMIENADRFGLSQLHQLRGRVGRGKYKSSCILLTDNLNDETRERLKIISSTNDGFRISDEDMRLRGMGDFFGERQHGIMQLKIADIAGDRKLLSQTQQAAGELLENDPTLDRYPLLKTRIEKLFSQNAENGMN
ncbi:MAG: ATP-dependent DNA helicase RecG [Oscillospiraceae bacterium]|nr:ATP-dependent DNA helicase RecG [Oscillospiraceae bacterium]